MRIEFNLQPVIYFNQDLMRVIENIIYQGHQKK